MIYVIYALLAVLFFLAIILYRVNAENNTLRIQLAAKNYFDQLPPEAEENEDAENIEVNDLTDEEEEQYASEAQKVNILCKLAKSHLDNLSDEYESSKLNERIEKAIEIAEAIPDQFYSFSALGFIIKLAHQAGLEDKKNELLNKIKDPVVKDMVLSNIND